VGSGAHAGSATDHGPGTNVGVWVHAGPGANVGAGTHFDAFANDDAVGNECLGVDFGALVDDGCWVDHVLSPVTAKRKGRIPVRSSRL
jgi:hypothetical protein